MARQSGNSKLTQATVKNTPCPATGVTRRWDSRLAGFHLEVRPNGRKTFRYRYKEPSGRQRTVTVARYGEMTAPQARKAAEGIAARVRLGENPAEERAEARSAPRVNDIARLVLSGSDIRETSRAKYWEQYERFVKPAIGTRNVSDIRQRDVQRIIDSVPGSKGVQGNRVRALLNKLFNAAERRGYIAGNPARNTTQRRERQVSRFMSEDDMRAIAEAAASESADPQGADVVMLLMLTGSRKGETLRARWQDIDLQRGVWIKPETTTKQGEPHHLELDRAVVDLLSRIRREQEEGETLVFPSPRSQGQPRHDIKSTWYRIRDRAGIDPAWRMHDLRHAYASRLAAAGVPGAVLQHLMGHASYQTTQRYVHANRQAMREAVENNSLSNVVDLSKYRKAG